MANLLDIQFSIERSSFPAGSICAVNYRYVLECDFGELEQQLGYSVWCEVWGRERFGDRVLGDAYDSHELIAQRTQLQSRQFIVPCEMLDDRLGEDRIYLKIKARATNGVLIQASSLLIKEHF